MKPLPGYDKAELAGGLEWQRERDSARDGIPISAEHQQSLEEIAAKLGVETPFPQFEHTRFNSNCTARAERPFHIARKMVRALARRF